MDERGQSAGMNPEWREFVAKADAEWAVMEEEERRIREEVMPDKVLPFRSPITHRQLVFEQDVPMRTRDGVTLRADVIRPDAPERFPVILMRTPYDKRASLDSGPVVMRNLAQRGYVTIIQDVRGKYASDGEFAPRISEVDDGYDTVEWAARQDWSNGKVGMWGVSYGGFSSLTAALAKAPHLTCIFPAMIGLKFLPYRNGTFGLQGRAAWLIWTTGRYNNNPLRIDFNHLPLNEIDDKAGYPSDLYKALVSMDLEKVQAAEMSFGPGDLSAITAKSCLVAGWYDELCGETLVNWPHLRQSDPDARLLIGPWHHNLLSMEKARIGALPTEKVELWSYLEEMERFFSTHLKEEHGDRAGTDAPVKLFVLGENRWRSEKEWPLARSQYTPFYLHSSGAAERDLGDGRLDTHRPIGEEAVDHFHYDPLSPVSWPPSEDVWEYLHRMGSCRDVELREDVLVYSSEELAQDLEVTGAIGVTLFAATDAEDTDFVVCLIDVHPDGHSQYLTNGIVRGRFKEGVENPRLLEPGQVYRYEFELGPTSNLFRKGHRIRVAVSSSDFSRFARNQNTADPIGVSRDVKVAHQTIVHSSDYPSHVVLPVIPRHSAVDGHAGRDLDVMELRGGAEP